jgi:phospholipase C
MKRFAWSLAALSLVFASIVALSPFAPESAEATSPIKHVIIIDEENHSFDDVLGKLCVEQAAGQLTRAGLNMACDGTDMGRLKGGVTRPLTLEPDYGLTLNHGSAAQRFAIDGGLMDGWAALNGCQSPTYRCLTQYDPLRGTCGAGGTDTCLPNISQYAKNFAISDRTFELRKAGSWAGHMVLGSATVQHFLGDNPHPYPGVTRHGGWGCDSGKASAWKDPTFTGQVPSCIPDQAGSMGPVWSSYTGVKPAYATTIFDRMDAGSVSWRIYGGSVAWSICPTFWECLGSSQGTNTKKSTQLFTDLQNGGLPGVSFVIPKGNQSAHQPQAMSAGDSWVGQVVSAVMQSPYWSSTAIFITFDDCGCFFDHVNPLQYNPEWSVRLPMLIVSPYARAGFTDSNPATVVSMLTFVEHTFGLQPLNPCATVDAWDPDCTDDLHGWSAAPTYDYADAFDFGQTPLTSLAAVHTRVPAAERSWLLAHPEAGDIGT